MEPSLLDWMNFLIGYAEDWDKRFRPDKSRKRLRYFTQEYWYLFTAVVRANAQGTPILRQEAFAEMRVPYDQDTFIARLKDAIADGYITEGVHPEDSRKRTLIPTALLEREMRAHLTETLNAVRVIVAKLPPCSGGFLPGNRPV